MADRVIDYDRGAVIKQEPNSGMDVFMYVDAPGEYLNAHGTVVPDTLARQAGYDIDRLAKEKLKNERKALAASLIDNEFQNTGEAQEIIDIRDGWRLVGIGHGQYLVRDPDDNILNKNPLPMEAAQKLVSLMAPEPEKEKSAG
jgi:hypothetical protein